MCGHVVSRDSSDCSRCKREWEEELPSLIVPRKRKHYDIVAKVGVAVIPKDYVFPAEMPSRCLHPNVYKDFKEGLAEGKCSACREFCYVPM